ncbi:MAG: bifunctional YncE family protein/alkaline phosphatase family protein [Acidobacteria bacterium]|nr:bifunctional YncE family protein/alkaline phosphatase family protein [Acidobacteriota bacterium]
MPRAFLAVVLPAILGAVLASTAAPPASVGPQPDGAFLLPNGWRLTPAGKQIPLSTFPMAMALSPDGRYLLVLNGGCLPPTISVVDVAAERETARVPVEDAWMGITFNKAGDRVYVGGGSKPFVFEFSFSGGVLKPARRFAALRDPRPSDRVGDVALSLDGRFIYAANLFRNSLSVLNVLTGFLVGEAPTGRRPYRTAFAPDGKTFYVSHWADGTVGQYNVSEGGTSWTRLDTIAVGLHPTDLLYLEGANEPQENEPKFAARLLVACANTNSVSVVGISEGSQARLLGRISVAFSPLAPAGSTPSALALSPNRDRLLVAASDSNAVAVVDVSDYQSEIAGFLPAGWYPTAVRVVVDGRIFIANGRGSFPNPGAQERPAACLETGSLSIVPPPTDEQLAAYSRQVLRNSPYQDRGMAEPPPPAGIRHVIYIIKDGLSYDQTLGDMKEGKGDVSLAHFGEQVTPNHHKLAREFVLLDNFYVNGETSADGLHWSTAAIANDFVQKMWPSWLAGRLQAGDFERAEPAAFPPAGYLWTNALSAGLTLRNYGLWVENSQALTGVARVRDPALDLHTDKSFLGFNPDYPDQKRADEFLREFGEYARRGSLPGLILMRLANDRVAGTEAAKSSARALVADNDYALGRIVEAISHSLLWPQIAIFVLEASAAGPDHVDSHRSPALVISPYARRGFVDSTPYNTASVLRTIEWILGLRPMTQFDAGAAPMRNTFSPQPDPRPYQVEKPRVNLEERRSTAPAPSGGPLR